MLVEDADRLVGQELLELFAALRTLTNWPFVHYVPAYDAAYVSTAIHSVVHTDGNDFIEKVIELPLLVPAIPFQHLYDRFQEQAKAPLDEAKFNTAFSPTTKPTTSQAY